MHIAKSRLFNSALFKHALQQPELPLSLFKTTYKKLLEQIKLNQAEGASAAEQISRYTWCVDQLVISVWKFYFKDVVDVELVAVGGYGRSELHPYSDIDLMILLKANQYEEIKTPIEQFLQFLWDIGFEVGHSVRSMKDCLKEAKQDITVMTNTLEGRHLNGDKSLFSALDKKVRGARNWPSEKFYDAKTLEQEQRHARYQDSAYSLEPNIKESPGGLRDLQSILWVYNRHFGVKSFRDMLTQEHIDKDEYRLLIRARNILWKIRSGLHLNANRREDRLLFDFQRELAVQFGYIDTGNHLAVEQLMKRYYRTVKQVIYLNQVLLSNYKVRFSKRLSLGVSKNLDDHFILKNKLILAREETLFEQQPAAILKLFNAMQTHQVKEIHPDTIRAIHANIHRINTEFRSNRESKDLFIELFKNEGIADILSKMNNFGVLGAYLPTFGAIVGQMQHDLFHVYTVDGHTLKVIQYLESLRHSQEEFPIAYDLLSNLYKPERLFTAALFHDIAKGRGGDHSELGKKDAFRFCIDHSMSDFDAKLVSWLVGHHLMMSHFSQRRDISDPDVIAEFAAIVGDIEHLDNLYLLTLSDIRGTSPKVWNAWKGQLLLELYKATSKALRRGIASPLNEDEHVLEDQQLAIRKIAKQMDDDFDTGLVEQFWSTLPADYFIRNEPFYIAWHAKSLIQTQAIGLPVVSVRYSERLEAHMFFIYAPAAKNLLSRVTYSFDKQEINIIEAHLHSSSNGFTLISFKGILMDQRAIDEDGYYPFLERKLRSLIMEPSKERVISRRNSSRALKHFPIKPQISFSQYNPHYTAMEVIAQDQPGLLHNVALILQRHNIVLLNAKIATFGEKAEDVFFVQRHDGTRLTDPTVTKLIESELSSALDKRT